MSFWTSPIDKKIDGSEENSFLGEFKIIPFKIIPDGTYAPAMIKSFEYATFEESQFYQIIWKIVDGEFKGQEVKHKIHAFDKKDTKRFRALNVMMRLYKLSKVEPTHSEQPSDDDLLAFKGKIHGIKISESYYPNRSGLMKNINWVSEIHPIDGDFKAVTGVKLNEPPFPVTHENNIDATLQDSFLNRNSKSSIEGQDIPF